MWTVSKYHRRTCMCVDKIEGDSKFWSMADNITRQSLVLPSVCSVRRPWIRAPCCPQRCFCFCSLCGPSALSHIVPTMPGDKTQVIMMLALPSGVESITCYNSGRSSLPLSSPWCFPGLFQSRLHLHTKMSSGEYLRQGLKIRCGVKIQMAVGRDTSPGIVLLYQVREVSPEPLDHKT